MVTLDRVNISADKYRWAIQRAGFAVDEYINNHPKVAISEWIDGTKAPTAKQLEDFAKSVNVPFGFLFLQSIPEETLPFPVFRGDAGRNDHFNLNVYDTVNAIQKRQNWLEDYLHDNDINTCTFVSKATLQTTIANAVARLRNALDLDPRWAFALANTRAAVSKLTEMLEFAGVFVSYNGVVGNNTHRVLKVSECRGFALVNEKAPYIFVNSGDILVAQLFTLIHEAAHIMLGVSAGHANEDSDNICNNTASEVWCDQVAAEFLVPADVLRIVWDGNIKACTKKFKVSEIVIARRAHDLNLLTDEEYHVFWSNYINRPVSLKKEHGGGNFYNTSVKRVGRLFAIHIRNAVVSRQLSYTEAYRLTGLYGKTYNQFMNNNI